MASQYDAFWTALAPTIAAGIAAAVTRQQPFTLAVPEIQALGHRQSWAGSVDVQNGQVLGRGSGAHMRAMGGGLRALSRMWSTVVLRCRMTRAAVLTVIALDSRGAPAAPARSSPSPSAPRIPPPAALSGPVDSEAVEARRRQFRPSVVRYLMIGESTPAGGTFFYDANSALFRHTQAACAAVFGPAVGEGEAFLRWWQDQGWYLEDLCRTSANALPAPERCRQRLAAEDDLVRRLTAQAPPVALVFTPVAMAASIARVVEALGWAVPVQGLPFPAFGWQPRFEAGMRRVLAASAAV